MTFPRLPGALLLTVFTACASAPSTTSRADFRRPPLPVRTGPVAPSQQTAAGQGLEDLLSGAEEFAPRLLIAQARHTASLQRAAQATEFPDPKLRLTWWAEEVQTRSGPMDARIMASQRLPWPGKLGAAGAVADAGSLAASVGLQAARAELRLRMTLAWNERVRRARAEPILLEHAELLTEIEGIAQVEAERENARPGGLIRVQVDLGQVRDQISALLEGGLQVHAQLEMMAGREVESERDWGAESFYPAAMVGSELTSVSAEHPLLRLHAAQIEIARQQIEVASLAGRPDFEVALDYTFVGDSGAPGVESGADPVSLSLGFDLPFGSAANDAREQEARASLGLQNAEMHGARLQLESRRRVAFAARRDADRRIVLYRGNLLPQAEEAFVISLAGYQAGSAPFLEVLDTARDLLRLRLDALQAEADLADARAELQYLTVYAPTSEGNR